MILIEREPPLPHAVEHNKAQVLLCLQTNHQIRDYTTRADLADFLEEVMDGLADIGEPRALRRVLLFYRNPNAIEEVQTRMLPGGSCVTFKMPSCWSVMTARLPELRAWAQRLDPEWRDFPLPAGVL